MLTEGASHRHHHHHHHRHHRHHHKNHKSHGRQRSTSKMSHVAGESTTEGESPDSGKKQVQQAGRVLRNRCYRRPFEDHRHTKRLFTPEIKRFLKSWLVRRRDNPYPSREEKKSLAVQTGLTYIQICNWFANWRRKLKKAGAESQQHTWGNLIKTYNTRAQGNVEQFSLSSDDSIWEERSLSDTDEEEPDVSYMVNATAMDHSYSALVQTDAPDTTAGHELSKWLESAARFKPSQNYVTWSARNITWQTSAHAQVKQWNISVNTGERHHQRDELDAAEALTCLSAAQH